MIIVAFINPAFNHYGVTMLFLFKNRAGYARGNCIWTGTGIDAFYFDSMVFLLQQSNDNR